MPAIKTPPKTSFTKNIFTALLIFMILAVSYSLVSDQFQKQEEVSFSQLVEEIKSGNIKNITVSGNDLNVVFENGLVKKSKKESESGLLETLKNYGVNEEQLSKFSLEIK
ncbi:MAG: ATP-dependent metallopeptidase FtsH/Yme1/Tma family protein, partial [Patescibacteria group bacterium]